VLHCPCWLSVFGTSVCECMCMYACARVFPSSSCRSPHHHSEFSRLHPTSFSSSSFTHHLFHSHPGLCERLSPPVV
jgi:hypothetical protein